MSQLVTTDLGARVDALLGFGQSGGVSIDFDLSFLAQMALFAVLAMVLKPLLFDPVLAIFEERDRRTDGARAEARAMQEKAGELLEKYQSELAQVHRVAAEERDKLRQETAKLEAEILEQARKEATKITEDGRQDVEEELHAIRFDLGRHSERLARDIAARALGREVS